MARAWAAAFTESSGQSTPSSRNCTSGTGGIAPPPTLARRARHHLEHVATAEVGVQPAPPFGVAVAVDAGHRTHGVVEVDGAARDQHVPANFVVGNGTICAPGRTSFSHDHDGNVYSGADVSA